MNSPTAEQAALIKASLEGKYLSAPSSWEQEKLLNVYKAKLLLEQVINLLAD
ncbi:MULTISPECIES: hypothetical protein [unclassified Nostoc]|uniref:hypothetical protein n=1 Tax=unclassified Nostoc TaxID=2593658 RepID=UPI00260BF5B9|nr:hypothetical protein [Nostoc sp. S13]MDF5738585.1 hypothetical protein [Nostoc sp. S13]